MVNFLERHKGYNCRLGTLFGGVFLKRASFKETVSEDALYEQLFAECYCRPAWENKPIETRKCLIRGNTSKVQYM